MTLHLPKQALADGLCARTRPLRPIPGLPDSLLRLAGAPESTLWREGRGGLLGQGVALRLELPGGLADRAGICRVGEVLASIASDDQVGLPGCGPLAIGALPFDPAAPGSLVIPASVIGWRDGQAWHTTVGPAGEAPSEATGTGAMTPTPHPAGLGPCEREDTPSAADSPDEFCLSGLPHHEWRQLVARALGHIHAGAFDKVVLARRVDVEANRPFVIDEVLSRLVALYPSCMVFHVDGFLGASPELLLRRVGCRVTTHPLAGTVARSGDPSADQELVNALMSSDKDRLEHQLVVDALAQGLARHCATIDVPESPSVLGLRNVSHLATRISGVLADLPARPTALELVADLHPTPAVAGTPVRAALAYLLGAERFDRGRYAGPVGWVDARGDGAWALGIRSAEVSGSHAGLFAGVGVVAGSDPAAELAETQLKLQALLAALVRP